jgi:NaMN:DMB phosphoribosyltransferase
MPGVAVRVAVVAGPKLMASPCPSGATTPATETWAVAGAMPVNQFTNPAASQLKNALPNAKLR